jgi:hypothetical protein
MNPVVFIGVSSSEPWDCHCDSNSWYTSCKFINFHVTGNNLHFDVILPNGRVDKDKHHIIDCVSRDYSTKINLTLKFEDGTEMVFNVRDSKERTDLLEFLEEYNSNGYEIKIDHSYELDEGFDDI